MGGGATATAPTPAEAGTYKYDLTTNPATDEHSLGFEFTDTMQDPRRTRGPPGRPGTHPLAAAVTGGGNVVRGARTHSVGSSASIAITARHSCPDIPPIRAEGRAVEGTFAYSITFPHPLAAPKLTLPAPCISHRARYHGKGNASRASPHHPCPSPLPAHARPLSADRCDGRRRFDRRSDRHGRDHRVRERHYPGQANRELRTVRPLRSDRPHGGVRQEHADCNDHLGSEL